MLIKSVLITWSWLCADDSWHHAKVAFGSACRLLLWPVFAFDIKNNSKNNHVNQLSICLWIYPLLRGWVVISNNLSAGNMSLVIGQWFWLRGGGTNRSSSDLLRLSFGAKLILEIKVQQEHIHDKLPLFCTVTWGYDCCLSLIHISAVSSSRHYLFFFFFFTSLSISLWLRGTNAGHYQKCTPIVCLPSLNRSTPRCFTECVHLVRQWQVMVMASITELVLSHR